MGADSDIPSRHDNIKKYRISMSLGADSDIPSRHYNIRKYKFCMIWGLKSDVFWSHKVFLKKNEKYLEKYGVDENLIWFFLSICLVQANGISISVKSKQSNVHEQFNKYYRDWL